LGTTSSAAAKPDDFEPATEEVLELIRVGQELFENLTHFRLLRAYTGTRPLYCADPNAPGREISRNFVIIDHATEGLNGLVSIVGGKLTTYRLMAEKITDIICSKMSVTKKCRTAEENLIEEPSQELADAAKRFFPAYGVELAASRLGPRLSDTLERIRENPDKKQLVCECELVTLAEVETVAAENTTFSMSDIRRRTRMGMGTCQGTYCGLRGVGTMVTNDLLQSASAAELLQEFLESRWHGIRPILWGQQIREVELTRGIYGASLNMDGVVPDER
jgi:glycerol-3-phosphate dehydrogenase